MPKAVRGRNPFTNKDQKLLANFLAKLPAQKRIKWPTFTRFIQTHPNTDHSQISWYGHYKGAGKRAVDNFIKEALKKGQAQGQAAAPAKLDAGVVEPGRSGEPSQRAQPGPPRPRPTRPRRSAPAIPASTSHPPRSSSHKQTTTSSGSSSTSPGTTDGTEYASADDVEEAEFDGQEDDELDSSELESIGPQLTDASDGLNKALARKGKLVDKLRDELGEARQSPHALAARRKRDQLDSAVDSYVQLFRQVAQTTTPSHPGQANGGTPATASAHKPAPRPASPKRAREATGTQDTSVAAAAHPAKKRRLANGPAVASVAAVVPSTSKGKTKDASVAIAVADEAAAVEPPQVVLKRALKAAAAKHNLTFKQVWSMFHSISAPTDLSLLDQACAYFAPDSPHHPAELDTAEYDSLKRKVRRAAWSPDEDKLVFAATAAEVVEIEEKKGRGCLVARRSYLGVMGITGMERVVAGWPWV